MSFFQLSKNKLLITFLFGFISGFTLIACSNSINFWLARENIDLKLLALFSFISLPYALNFLTAPIFDILSINYFKHIFGHRLSWVVILLLLLTISSLLISYISPSDNLFLFAIVAFIMSFLSATKDSIFGAIRAELIPRESQGVTSGLYIFGYRIGMLLAGYGSIYLSYYIGWHNIYKIFAFSILLSLALILFILKNFKQELEAKQEKDVKIPTIGEFVKQVNPSYKFSLFILIISFLLLYRLPDDCISVMMNPFLLYIGYNEIEIANLGKLLGIFSACIGGFIASFTMHRKSIIDNLLYFGILHAFSHILFIILGLYGKNQLLFIITIFIEGVTSGMNMAAYIGFITSICSGRFKTTQYAFFTSMMGLSRSIFPAFFGYILIDFGWNSYFIFIIIATIPSLIILWKLRNKL
jgi:PAT family beta-lactamase induction signal transducer AmpG